MGWELGPPGNREQGPQAALDIHAAYGGNLTFAGCQFRGAGHASGSCWAARKLLSTLGGVEQLHLRLVFKDAL